MVLEDAMQIGNPPRSYLNCRIGSGITISFWFDHGILTDLSPKNVLMGSSASHIFSRK